MFSRPSHGVSASSSYTVAWTGYWAEGTLSPEVNTTPYWASFYGLNTLGLFLSRYISTLPGKFLPFPTKITGWQPRHDKPTISGCRSRVHGSFLDVPISDCWGFALLCLEKELSPRRGDWFLILHPCRRRGFLLWGPGQLKQARTAPSRSQPSTRARAYVEVSLNEEESNHATFRPVPCRRVRWKTAQPPFQQPKSIRWRQLVRTGPSRTGKPPGKTTRQPGSVPRRNPIRCRP